MKNPEKAVEYLKNGFNCSQSVLKTFAPSYGLDDETCTRLAAPFGGGIGHLQETCGAVTGAIMVLGLRHGAGCESRDVREHLNGMVQAFVAEFKERHGSVVCRTLLGCDISTKSGLEAARARGAFVVCADYVRTAAELLDKRL